MTTDVGPGPDAAIVNGHSGNSRRHRSPWPMMTSMVVGAVVFGLTAQVCRVARDRSEQALLQQQTDQAGLVLGASVAQAQSPLDGVAIAAAATGGDPEVFNTAATPLLHSTTPYRTVVLFRRGSVNPVTQVGDTTPVLLTQTRIGIDDMQRAADGAQLGVSDFLADSRVLGYAVASNSTGGDYIVYAERALPANPNQRRRSEPPFDSLEYAIYLGTTEQPNALLGASLPDEALPIEERRATVSVPFGTSQLTLVTTPAHRLTNWLLWNLWWITLATGLSFAALAGLLLTGLSKRREQSLLLAKENATLYRQQRDVAESLQLSLLPQSLTYPPNTEIASRYWPATQASLIGGDFYDSFRIDDRRWGFTIGDICGHGIDAAGPTSLVRHTLRSVSHFTTSPSTALQAVHDAMCSEGRPATFCTMCWIVFEPNPTGGGQAVMSLAGHPQPILIRNNTAAQIGSHGTLLGMVTPHLSDDSITIHTGDLLVLYTDGFTDAPLHVAITVEELISTLTDAPVVGAADAAHRIDLLVRSKRPDSTSNDDTALLLIAIA